jgi:Fic family protein
MLFNHKNAIEFMEETLTSIVGKVRHLQNPVEAAFFLWVNVAYLQPFADGNKRTSRLSANMPLMLYNCAPLSFLDVERADHATALLGVYEQRSVAVRRPNWITWNSTTALATTWREA